jgi:hypothetical protein
MPRYYTKKDKGVQFRNIGFRTEVESADHGLSAKKLTALSWEQAFFNSPLLRSAASSDISPGSYPGELVQKMKQQQSKK